MGIRITAAVMCYNEADFIYPCLQAILPLVDQTIIWDGDFWIGNHDPGRPDVLTQGSTDGSVDLIHRAIAEHGQGKDITFLEFKGTPKMAEDDARNMTLQLATGDYLLIVDADEIWNAWSIERLKNFALDNPDVDDFFIRNRLFFWNPFFYVLTKHMRLFKLRPGREFYGANEVTGCREHKAIPYLGTIDIPYLFDHYGYINPQKVEEKMKWYDGGTWRGCGSWWFKNIYMGFDGTLEGARELFKKNYNTLHPWGKVHPGFAAEEFTPLLTSNPTHHSAMRQYFDRRGFPTDQITFAD